ncbi:hypothetical protein GCM10009535_33540 [Streptomyces thermocarboxydovorans]|uniref:Sap, sulfolipid-1-addressing protein n=2 Tax=Streptomyces thermocarboxydovorans TaxID=59298 RepID=A0ABP3SQ92_9ACTN
MVLDLLLIALAITLDPLPLMAFAVVVASARGTRAGLVFIAGWTACFVVVITLVLTLTGGRPPEPRSPPSTAHLALKLLVGLCLVAYGIHRHRHPRPPAEHPADREPGDGGRGGTDGRAGAGDAASSGFLTSRIERGVIWPAAALAVLLQPWGLVAAGAVTVVDGDTSKSDTWLTLVAFCVIATAGLLAAELYALLRPEAAAERLLALRTWMTDHAERAIVTGSVVTGLYLVARSAYGLAR